MPESNKAQQYFFLGLLVFILVLNALVFLPYLGPLVLAMTLAVACSPWHRKIVKLMPKFPNSASFLTLVLVLVIIFAPLGFLVMIAVDQAQDVYISLTNNAEASRFLNNFSTVISQEFQTSKAVGNFIYNLNENTKLVLQYILGNASAVFSATASIAAQIFLVLLALFFFLRDGENLKSAIMRLSPLRNEDDETILNHLGKAMDSIVKGTLLLSLIQALVASVGFLIFGVPNAALLGALTFFAAFIPGFGSALILIPAAVYLYFTGPLSASIGMLLWSVLVGLVDNFVRPKILSSGTGMHPLLVLLAVFGGISLFGPYGLLIGPLLLSFLFALTDLYKKGVS